MERGEIESVHLGASRRIPLAAAYAFVERLVAESTERVER
jgi:hypothetical protein